MAVLRDKSIKIRVTADELSQLNARKTCDELARWMRETCLGHATKRGRIPDADPALLRSLAAIGNNLNQVAKRVNTTAIQTADAVSVVVELQRIADALEQLRRRDVS
jgi:hypothetical protein